MQSKYLKCDDIEPGDIVYVDKKEGSKTPPGEAAVVHVFQVFAGILQGGELRDIMRNRLTKKVVDK